MAACHEVKFNTADEMIERVCALFAKYYPRDPVPGWWNQKQDGDEGWRAQAKRFFADIADESEDGPPFRIMLRTEAFGPEDGEDGEDYSLNAVCRRAGIK